MSETGFTGDGALEIVNVIGWVSYRQELDLAALRDTFETRSEITDVTYKPAENHWLQTNFAPDGTYVAFYRSGKASITGVDSVSQLEDVVDRVNAVMRDLLEFDFTPESQVSNIVVTTTVNTNISLEALALELGLERVEYEPEQFPALIYRDQESDAVILVFSSGKLLCTGLADLDTISNTVTEFTARINPVT
jgi:transcription initiation factor TFIID TATA-box-binding protein